MIVRPQSVIGLTMLLMLVVSACGRATARSGEWAVLTPRVGGMLLPTVTGKATPDVILAEVNAVAIATATAIPTPTPPPAPLPAPAQAAPSLQIGQTIVAVGANGMWLYAAAESSAPVIEVYPAGTTFTVVEPNNGFTSYPVLSNGRTFYRLQAADGLVGWGIIEAVVPTS